VVRGVLGIVVFVLDLGVSIGGLFGYDRGIARTEELGLREEWEKERAKWTVNGSRKKRKKEKVRKKN
jgi:hypothetical protein